MTRPVIWLVTAGVLITAAATGLYSAHQLRSGNQLTASRSCLDRTVDDASPAASPAMPESASWGCVGDETAGILPHGPMITAC